MSLKGTLLSVTRKLQYLELAMLITPFAQWLKPGANTSIKLSSQTGNIHRYTMFSFYLNRFGNISLFPPLTVGIFGGVYFLIHYHHQPLSVRDIHIPNLFNIPKGNANRINLKFARYNLPEHFGQDSRKQMAHFFSGPAT